MLNANLHNLFKYTDNVILILSLVGVKILVFL